MKPFQEFRYWVRRAPASERVSAGVAAAVMIGLLSYLLVPSDEQGSDAVEVAASVSGDMPTSPGEPVAGASDAPLLDPTTGEAVPNRSDGPLAQASVEGDAPAVSTEPATNAGCVSPPGRARGITDNEVRVLIALTEIFGPAANTLFDVPTPAEAKADFEAVIDGINREGGVACRKLVAKFVNVNPTDESQMMQVCRDLPDADVYAIIDTGSLARKPAVLACIGQLKIPYFGASPFDEALRRQFHPYLFNFFTKDLNYRHTAFAMRDLGVLGQGFTKLGFIYKSCEPEAIDAYRGWLRDAGVGDERLVTYSIGCPSAFANPADLQQAVLTFQREGVSHVTTANFLGDFPRFTDIAERQGFRPKYFVPDEGLLSIAEGSSRPNPDNIANALAITVGRDGEQQTPGITPHAGTAQCNSYLRAAGQPTVYEQPANAGNACGQLWMLRAALGQAPDLSPAALAAGLQRAKSVDFSYPQGPNDFSGNGVTTGGQFWRVAQFKPDCDCWQVVQREFRRGA